MAAFTGLADDDISFAINVVGFNFSGNARISVARFKRRTITLKLRLVGFSGAQGLVIWQKEVTGKAVFHFNNFTHVAELRHAFEKNNLHFRVLPLADHIWQQAQEAGALDGLGQFALLQSAYSRNASWNDSVSYTHLTLPTIYSV